MRFLLPVLAVICNFFMDEIQFHWDRFFGTIITAGSKLEAWMNPSISWNNKYFDSDILTALFSTLLVWTTDFWHFLKFIMLSSVFLFVLLQEKDILMKGITSLNKYTADPILIQKKYKWWQYVIMVIALNLIWGIIFEFLNMLMNIL